MMKTQKTYLKTRLTTTAAAVCFAVGMLSVTTNSYAGGMLGELSSMVKLNATRGGVYKSQLRGGFVGGGVVVRVPTAAVHVFQFTPPGYSVGCGGIDMFGGSFSFINSAQLKAIFRNIAMSAAAAAFKRMLGAIEPKLEAIMGQFQGIMQALNQLAVDTCETGLAIEDSLFGDGTRMNNLTKSMKGLWDTITGESDGGPTSANIETKHDTAKNNKAVEKMCGNGTLPYCGNVVWNLLAENQAQASLKLKLGQASVAEVIQSLLGTMIYDPNAKSNSETVIKNKDGNVDKSTAENPADPADQREHTQDKTEGAAVTHGWTLTFEDFRTATNKDGGKGSGKQILGCSDGVNKSPTRNKCLTIKIKDWGFEGIDGMTNEILYGAKSGGEAQPGSLLWKVSDKCGEGSGLCELTDQQQNFVDMVGMPFYTFLRELSKSQSNPEDSLRVLENFASAVESELVNDIHYKIVLAYSRAVNLAMQGGKTTKVPPEIMARARSLSESADAIVAKAKDTRATAATLNEIQNYVVGKSNQASNLLLENYSRN